MAKRIRLDQSRTRSTKGRYRKVSAPRKQPKSKARAKAAGKRALVKIRPGSKPKKSYKKVASKVVSHRRAISRKRPRRMMLMFSNGKAIRPKVSRKIASTIGQYLNAVDEFLTTNDPDHLKSFVGRSIKDRARKSHVFETRPNVLYRLNAGIEPFEEVYRILT